MRHCMNCHADVLKGTGFCKPCVEELMEAGVKFTPEEIKAAEKFTPEETLRIKGKL